VLEHGPTRVRRDRALPHLTRALQSFRSHRSFSPALSGPLRFTVQRPKFNEDFLSSFEETEVALLGANSFTLASSKYNEEPRLTEAELGDTSLT
jgi:hypothetical protein